MTTIVTHDRVFHADEIIATAVLRIVFPDAKIIRTREPAQLHALAGKPDTYLLDVGGQFNSEKGLYDHHQPQGAGYRNEAAKEWPYATAGLVWRDFGSRAVGVLHPDLAPASRDEIVSYLDDALIRYLDAVDCGVRLKTAGPTLSALIASFNTTWYEKEEGDSFQLVLHLAQVILTNFIRRYAGKIMGRDKVREARPELDGSVLVLDTCLPWSGVVAEEMPEVLFVAYPVMDERQSAYSVQWQLRAAVNTDSTLRMYLPQTWAGRDGGELVAVSGVQDAIFCHRSRHLAGAHSKQGILTMAEKAIETHLRLQKELSQAA